MNAHFSIIWGSRKIKNPQLSLCLTCAVKRLKSLGVKASDRIAICDENSVEYVILLLALWQIKALAALISPRWPDKTMASYAARINARHLFRSADIKRIVGFDARRQIEAWEYKDLDLKQEVTIMATSGCSGEAKAVVHTWGNHFYSAAGSKEVIPLTNSDRWLLSLPMYHVSGLAIMVRCLLSGAGLVIPVGDDLMAAVKGSRATHLSLVSTQLQRLLANRNNHALLRWLKCILLGGSAIPRALMEQSVQLGLNIYLTYGLTEMASQVATGKVTGTDQACIKVLPYRQLSISSEGEILVKGEVLFKGYVAGDKLHLPLVPGVIARSPGASVGTTKQSLSTAKNDLWFATGDMGRLDQDGCLTVTGRRDSMFISGGENIHPEEIEKALLNIKGVEQAVIVPKQDQEFGHRPIAFIKFAGEPLPEDYLIRCLQAVLPRFKIPVAFFPWPKDLMSQGVKISRWEFFKALLRR